MTKITSDTDKHICKFLLSSFSVGGTGFKTYKTHFGLSFPEPRRAISNRINYLKKLQRDNFQKFSETLQSYGVTSGRTTNPVTEHYSSDYSTESEDEDYNTPVAAPRQSRTYISKQSPPKERRTTTSNMPSKKPIDSHQECLNDKFPQLSTNMTMWFRDEKVDIDGSYYSVLNIYMPLTDARDLNVIKLHLDKAYPKRLYLVHPKCPTFMYRDFKAMHGFEEDDEYPDIYATSKMNHKHFAFDIKKKEHMKLEITEYELPFALSNMKLGRIDNHGSEIMKHYRKVDCPVKDGITQECKFVFWKILIDEERSDDADENIAEDAFNWMEDRAKDPPGLLCRDQVVGMEEEKAPPFLGYVIEYGEKHLPNEYQMPTATRPPTPTPTPTTANEYKMPPTVSIQQTKEIVLFQEGHHGVNLTNEYQMPTATRPPTPTTVNEYKMPPTVSIQQTKEIVLFQEGDEIHPASEEIVPDYPISQEEYPIGPVYEPEYPNGPEIPDRIESNGRKKTPDGIESSSVVQRNKKQKVNDLKPMDEDDESI